MAKTVFAILGKRAPACWHAIPAALPGMTALSCMQAEPASGSFERRGAACWLFVPSCAPSQGRRLSGSARHRLRAAAGTGPATSLRACGTSLRQWMEQATWLLALRHLYYRLAVYRLFDNPPKTKLRVKQ